jgi:hypothetical protein
MEKIEQSVETLLHYEAKSLLEKRQSENRIVSGVFQKNNSGTSKLLNHYCRG